MRPNLVVSFDRYDPPQRAEQKARGLVRVVACGLYCFIDKISVGEACARYVGHYPIFQIEAARACLVRIHATIPFPPDMLVMLARIDGASAL